MNVSKPFYKRLNEKENTLWRAFKFDKDKEYVDGTFNKFLEENKIKDEYSVPYAHEQNGFIECDNQIVMEVIKNILHVKGLLKCPWAKVTNTIVHVLNKTMTKVLDGLTPFEKWAWSTPNISYFWIFGCLTYKHIPKEMKKTLTQRGRKWYLFDIHQITKDTIYRTHIHTKSQLHLIWTLMKEPIIFDKLIHDVVYQYLWLTMDILCPTIVQKTMWVQHQQEDHTRGCNMKIK